MDFEPRLTILHQAGMLSEEDYRKVQDVIRFFQEKYGLTLTEENASAMVTHLCAALGRIHRGEPVEPLSEEDYRKVQDVIRFFQEKYGLTLTEENASAMVTHLCAALGRIHRGEPVEPLDEEVYEETSQEPTFPKALEATQALVREILPDLPEDEQKFLTMHIGVVLAQL